MLFAQPNRPFCLFFLKNPKTDTFALQISPRKWQNIWVKRSLGQKKTFFPEKWGPPTKISAQEVWTKLGQLQLMCPNVARTYVAWPISSWWLASVKDGPRNLPLKLGQNLFSKSWDIPNMDKCCQENVAWTNVIMTRGSHEPTFKIWSKSGQ